MNAQRSKFQPCGQFYALNWILIMSIDFLNFLKTQSQMLRQIASVDKYNYRPPSAMSIDEDDEDWIIEWMN